MKGKAWLISALIAVLVLSVSLIAGCGAKKPTAKPELSTINPVSGPEGTKAVIIGANLGDTQGDSVVHIGDKVADVSAWSDTEVTVKVPDGLTQDVQGVTVLTPAGESNELSFAVTAPGSTTEGSEGEVEYPTPVSAMQEWMEGQGIKTTGWTFSVIKVSSADPTWRIDQATKPGSPDMYFLLHKVNNNWKVVDEGSSMTPDELQGTGAPGDLWVQVPAPTAPTQQQVIENYLKDQGVNLSEANITFIMQSKIDPTWELFQVSFAPEAQMATSYLVLHKENGNWVVMNYASDVDKTPGMPADLVS
jgi:hypothetical protein